MNPEEKAKEIIGRFIDIDLLRDFEGMDYELSKQCAIICVDEIIEETSVEETEHVKEINGEYVFTLKKVYSNYWQQVKSEIENL